ncbi:hypothetical protein NEMBOFW57_009341 [Staphylotrichum longicolle]|uniref:Uncharacterized protein n=1 Tax=Staphylotrichum longicolle TaxID=669026 RepID=A0AAD4HVD3_9PEZI|nr:hypothetical protein NEMBOFW57_009341 [Staphylotrichum longicolle]
MQRDLRYENSVLKGQLENITSQRRIIAQLETKSLRPTDRTIWQEFQLIATELKDACSSVEITIPPASADNNGDHQESKETNAWAQRLAGCSFNRLLSLAISTDISDFHLATALAGAAISDLVFTSKFPDFLARETPLLDHYRHHILTRTGPQTLTNLDTLASHSVTTSPYFQSHFLPATANRLSTQFSHSLSHLLSANDETVLGTDLGMEVDMDTDTDTDAVYPPLTSANTADDPVARVFRDPFTRALQLKTSLVLARNKYRLVFFRPGVVFDAGTMVRDGQGWGAFVPVRGQMRKKGKKDCKKGEHGEGKWRRGRGNGGGGRWGEG